MWLPFGAKKRRSFKNKTGGFFSQLMMEREYGRKDARRDDNKNSKTLNLEHYNNDTAKEILSIVLCCCSSSGFDGFIICRSVKKISTQVMMMILSQPCWVSNIYGLTYKLECALLVHQLHTYVANYPST